MADLGGWKIEGVEDNATPAPVLSSLNGWKIEGDAAPQAQPEPVEQPHPFVGPRMSQQPANPPGIPNPSVPAGLQGPPTSRHGVWHGEPIEEVPGGIPPGEFGTYMGKVATGDWNEFLQPEPGDSTATRTGKPLIGTMMHALSPINLGIMAGTAGAGEAAAASNSANVQQAYRAVRALLGGYFAVQSVKTGGQSLRQAKAAYDSGDTATAVGHLGSAGIDTFMAYLGTKEATKNYGDVATIAKVKNALQDRLNAEQAAESAAEKMGRQGPKRIAAPPAEPTSTPAEDLGNGWRLSPAVDKMEATIREAEQQAIAERTPAPPPAAPAIPSRVPKPADSGMQGWKIEPAEEATAPQPVLPGASPLESPASLETAPINGAAGPESSIAPGEPGWVGNIPTTQIMVDAPRFQFKQNVGQGGAGEELREVARYDPEKAGVTSVWKDPADGKTYVVNGHHRVELAQRTGYPEMTVRYLDAADAQQARAKGALINISEGRGESTDAAKVFRDMNATPESLAAEGVSLKGKIASEGLALSRLAQPIFDDVMSGELTPARGAVIGAGVPEHADQQALYDLVKQREKGGKRLTNDQIGELIRLTNEAPKQTETQDGLFGSEEMTRSLLPEKAEVSDYIRKQLSSEKKLFATVGTQGAAERLSTAGNVIKAEENASTAQRAAQGIALYDKLSTRSGPIATALDRAAQAIADGENANDVKQRTYKEIRSSLRSQADQLAGVLKGSVRGVEGLGSEGALQAGAGERNPAEGPALAKRVEPPSESGGQKLPSRLADLLAGSRAERVERSGAQLAETLRVNAHAAEVLRRAYKQGSGGEMGPIEGAAAHSQHVRSILKGLDQMAQAPDLTPVARKAAAGLAADLRKASAGGLKPVAIATPKAEAHEHIHFALDGLEFDAEKVLEHGPTRVAATRARLRGLAHGSDERVIREVMTRIASGEHDTLELERDEAEDVLHRFARNAVPRSQKALGILKELTHADFKTAIPEAGPGDETARGKEPGSSTPGSSGGGGPSLSRSVRKAGAEEAPDEGPEVSRRVKRNEEDQAGLFDSDSERKSQLDAEHNDAQLLHDRLTAQLRSGGAVKPSRLKPATNRGLFEEEQPEQDGLFGGERGSFSLKPSGKDARKVAARASGRLAEQNKQYGEDVRSWYTARRDTWTARVNQELARLRKILPDPIDQEALAIYRDFKNKPGELKQWLAGTHPGYAEVRDIATSRENIEKLRAPIERAMNPTDVMREADQALTKIAAVSLAEGQRLGFIDKHVKPEEYVTHLLFPEGEEGEPSKGEQMGKALGNKIGRNFPYNQQRNFPTLLEAAANNFKPRTLNAFTAFQTYGDKFATARATHLLIQQLRDSNVGVWGTKSDKGIPKGWVEIAPHAHPFRNLVGFTDAAGNPQGAYQTLFVPPTVEAALRPITDPDYTSKIAGFRSLRVFQSYTKAAQLGLSFFHATSENYMALANMGARGWLKGLQADRDAPGFLEREMDFIAHGGTTSIQGHIYEAHQSVPVSSLPSAGEAWRTLPGIRHVDHLAQKITELTFGKLQRQFKVVDYSIHKAAWLAQHPDPTPAAQNTAMRSIAKEVNSVYGGLHWENLGVNKSTVETARALLLAPDWSFSNLFNVKYAMEGTPAGKLARMFWLRAMVGGMIATQLMSMLLSQKPSKRPTQVYMGQDKDGKDIYQNVFFKGAPGDVSNLIYNIKDYGAVIGIARTVGNKMAPVLRTADEIRRNENFFGRALVPKGMNPVAGTVRGAWEVAKGVAPVPWSMGNVKEMLFGPESGKYKIPLEVMTTLFAGTPPSHISDKPPKEATNSVLDQILTGKIAPSGRAPADPASKLKREQKRMLKP
jgi:hypothetical protein